MIAEKVSDLRRRDISIRLSKILFYHSQQTGLANHMLAHKTLFAIALLLMLFGCSDAPSSGRGNSKAMNFDFQFWVLETPMPTDDIVLVIDGEAHQFPLAIQFASQTDQWRTASASDSRIECSLGNKTFVIESLSGKKLIHLTDLLYDTTAGPDIPGIKHSLVFYKSDSGQSAAWSEPRAKPLLAAIERGEIEVVFP